MNILALDTATEACSAALYIDGELSSRYEIAPRQHSRLILQMIDDLLAQAGLQINAIDAIAFGRGPGSFMGLRIAAGVVQGIAFAHDIPVIPISTLKTIAQVAYEKTQNKHVLVAIDARMDEVYWAAYTLKERQWHLQDEERVISPDKVSLPEISAKADDFWVGAGTGWTSYQDRLLKAANCQLPTILTDCFPDAGIIAKLAVDEFKAGNTVSAAEAVPIYLRNDVAKKPKPVVL
ncbi:MAG: tRNA (adenosine(37)-N6)-threonylcarbamoyltransferase complex dimerization subunit type 1 TsaB [Gammaproteobacteria bacterium]|nr:tRNA (adenosine(37)-N6)-threonylcarbamoyltransferase complex dimerization subunit type 1 TsaB [Gammaproteobacteria bacterium]